MIKRNWWKATGALLLLFSVIAGLLIRMGPGILQITPNNGSVTDTVHIHITGYATHFKSSGDPLQAWILNDSARIHLCADEVIVSSEIDAEASFRIGSVKIAKDQAVDCHLVLKNKQDGLIMLGEGFHLHEKTGATNDSIVLTGSKCDDKIQYTDAVGMHFPFRGILDESIRNLFYHVPMWFAMISILSLSLYYSIRYLRTFDRKYDILATETIKTAVLFGVLGLITGSIWARFTWGDWWVNDVKLNGAAITMLIYLAHLVLRSSIDEEQKRAKIAAVYSIFAFSMMIVFLMVFPRIADSLHPGNGGNPGFNKYDLDSTMRLVFYPAVLGWVMIGLWIANLRTRIAMLNVEC